MAISYHYARQFIGQSVCAHCGDGRKYYGIVREVTLDGIWLESIPVRGVPVSSKAKGAKVITADRPEVTIGEPVLFGFGRFFIPFFFLLALTPFLFFSPFFF